MEIPSSGSGMLSKTFSICFFVNHILKYSLPVPLKRPGERYIVCIFYISADRQTVSKTGKFYLLDRFVFECTSRLLPLPYSDSWQE